MHFRLAAALSAAAFVIQLSIATPLAAHEGHDHAADAPLPPSSAAARGEATGAAFELVAVARPPDLVITLDDSASNAPITGALIEVETPQGLAKAAAQPDGTYALAAPWLAKPGRHDLTFTVTAGTQSDILPVTLEVSPVSARDHDEGTGHRAAGWLVAGIAGFGLGIGAMLVMRRRSRNVAVVLVLFALLSAYEARAHEGEDHSQETPVLPSATGERAARLADGSLFVPKGTQRIFAIRTAISEQQRHPRSVELPGRVIADPNASGYVQAAVGGRLSPPDSGLFPRLGAAVAKGDVLAYVTAPLQAIDVSDMRQRQGEIEQQINIVQRRVTRFAALVPNGAASQVQLEEAQLELQGLKDRRAALERAKLQPEALTAPVDGIIADGTPIAGQMAQPNAIIFNIIDPSRLWIEALSFEAIGTAQTQATVKRPDGKTYVLTFKGAGFADRNQTIPIHFAINDRPEGLRVGQFVPVQVATGEVRNGIALPRASVVRSASGQDFVYEHVTAERFIARPVRIEALDSERVMVVAGIEAGKRIVVQGAELLEHIR